MTLPYKRPFPLMIVQDPALLLKIESFDYDLSDPDFVEYFENRTGYLLKRISFNQRGEEVDPNWAFNLELFGDPKKPLTLGRVKKIACKHFGKKKADLIDRIVFLEITKAKLQDAYEIYRREVKKCS